MLKSFVMKSIFTAAFSILSLWTFSSANTSPAEHNPVQVAKAYIYTHLDEWDLAANDVADMTISDMYTDKSSGITRIYFLQRYKSIPVYNAILNVCLTKEGKVYYSTSRFVKGLAEKANATKPAISPSDAIGHFTTHLGLPYVPTRLKMSSNGSAYIFERTAQTREDITVELNYQPQEGKLRLAWTILFCPQHSLDQWNARIDAVTGTVLEKDNWTLYCRVDEGTFNHADHDCAEPNAEDEKTAIDFPEQNAVVGDPSSVGQYLVWPAPLEGPNQGPRSMAINPADSMASPYGWHDVNGQPGAEYTITRGNNVFAYQDREDLGYSSNDEPDGGPNLIFNPPFDPAWEPEQYKEASVVNLFYWINYLHDFSYQFGFDEASGNFQRNNYGRGGVGGDFVWAVAQSGAETDTLHNNAVFYNKNEGTSPAIFMYDFLELTRYVTVNEPPAVKGLYRTNLPSAGWGAGAYVTDVPVTGEVVLVDDGVEAPSTADACEEILNASALAGKIAMIDRGTCQYSYKALQAQHAGAIGVIICNTLDNKEFTLGAGPDGASVNIPVVLINVHSSKILREFVGKGLKVTIVKPASTGPARLTSDMQNSMIAHEYGHGISIRLAGGPDKVCLDNAEQMGEGWSDFFGLVTTVQPGDTGTKMRGLSTYVLRENADDNGLRRYPYSTDMTLSPLTYDDVAASPQKHDLGEVWANMLWDMYWALSDKYGWSANLYDETSGNYKAVRLVVDGLKNMACDPGFVDGRNAILAADEALYNGENACLLWEVFARRGLGYSADQGSSDDAGDQTAAFDLPPVCSGKIFIEKSTTALIQPGEEIQVTINVGNYKNETVSNVVVKDIIPEGTSFKPNSSNHTAIQQGNALFFELGTMPFLDEEVITYTLQTSTSNWSQRLFLDDVPDENNVYWISNTIGTAASNNWIITDSLTAHTGQFSWSSKEIPERSQQALILNPDTYAFHVDGEHPALRFYHRFNTQAGMNGGMVEVRETGTSTWQSVSQYMVRNGYKRSIDYRTFLMPRAKAFSGIDQDTFEATYVDLLPWIGKDIQVRFRFGTFLNTHNGDGWTIDDIEFMDLLAYNEAVCVTTAAGDYECTVAKEHGTIVDSRETPVSTEEPSGDFSFRIYPNPANDVVTVSLSSDNAQEVNVGFWTMEGKQLYQKSLTIQGNDFLNIHTSSFIPGLYFLKINSGARQQTEKVIIHH